MDSPNQVIEVGLATAKRAWIHRQPSSKTHRTSITVLPQRAFLIGAQPRRSAGRRAFS